MIDAAVEWAVAPGPPNWMFALALLTHPKVWSGEAVRAVRNRLGDGPAGDGDPADGEVQA
ncbi:hypothetical protein [Halorubrum sodomense]|uniref:hypothetical protein n=1 Tax=Halorubrum sodomense TaxID=35743 RepID=UPI001160D1DD|nr:hypothetical protein [Halorubrum sodomense]